MNVEDVFLLHELTYEFLSFFGGQVCRDDWDLRVVSVALPVYAYCFESGVGECRGEAGVSATDFDGTCSFSFFRDVYLEPDDVAPVLIDLDWVFRRDVCFGALFILFLGWGYPPEILEGGRAGPYVALVWFGCDCVDF